MAVFSLQEVKALQVQNVADENFESWSESNNYGYFAGGYGPSYNNTISRIDFSSETTQNPGKNVSLLVYTMAGIENSN